MTRYIIDRIEDGFAVCEREDGGFDSFPAEAMPPEAKESDCLILDDDGVFAVDAEETERRRERIRELLRKMREAD